jgi:hypothetical protein
MTRIEKNKYLLKGFLEFFPNAAELIQLMMNRLMTRNAFPYNVLSAFLILFVMLPIYAITHTIDLLYGLWGVIFNN